MAMVENFILELPPDNFNSTFTGPPLPGAVRFRTVRTRPAMVPSTGPGVTRKTTSAEIEKGSTLKAPTPD